jgi:hypothetical protein
MTGILKIWILLVFIGWSIPASVPDDEEKTAIMAIKAGDIELLQSYLDQHPDRNCTFSNGKTGLYYAIVYEQPWISEFLLSKGADPNLEVDDKSTLEWAVRNDQERIARLLIEFGADVNKPDNKGNTPLISAAELNNLEMCKILVDRGADVFQKNLKGKSARDFAINYGESPAYKYLILMEKQRTEQESAPSMQDGPYIFREGNDRIVMTYYERRKDKDLTRLFEKTFETGESDAVVNGFGWDTNSYHIKHKYEPEPYLINTTGDIFASGDIHGKYSALVNLLKNNKIIDSDLSWNFGNGQLVLLGDVFDRGEFITETLWFLHELEVQARLAGGNVHLLLGNHEVMALTGDHRYLNEKYKYFTNYTLVYYYELFEKNTVLGEWLRSRNLIVQINDCLFMHAGISPQFAEYNYEYQEVNTRVRNYLYSDYNVEPGSPEDIILGAIGPQWYRGYRYENDSVPKVTQQFIDDYLKSKHVGRMVLGHNEQLAISTDFEGKVINIDVAIDASGMSAQGLLISGEKLFRCHADGTREQLE